jgi:hypothetical protein
MLNDSHILFRGDRCCRYNQILVTTLEILVTREVPGG